jgi:uncharacterized protein YqhQ
MENNKKLDFAVGGQAVIEGVMMRSKENIIVAVRRKSGEITLKQIDFKPIFGRSNFLKWPFLRGVFGMIEMMIIGTKALNYSAQVQIDDEDETLQPKENSTERQKTKKEIFWEKMLFGASFVVALLFSLFLFKFIPYFTSGLISEVFSGIGENYLFFNLIDGGLKLVIFVAYISIISLMPGIREVFMYHGAEHKAIFAYENDLELTAQNAAKQSRFHPRCGTSFILLVFLISILLYTVLPKHPDFWSNFGLRLLALPLIAGVSYEFLKFSAKFLNQGVGKIFVIPGLWLQRLTTREPNQAQLEVAVESLKEVLRLEEETK